MRTTFSPTIFDSSPVQSVLTQDALKVDGQNNPTSVKDILLGFKDDAINAVRNTPQIASTVAQIAIEAKQGYLTKGDAALRIATSLGGRGSVLNNLSTGVSNKIFQTLGVGSKQQGMILASVGDVVRLQRSSNLTNTNGMIRALSSLLGSKATTQLFDLQAESAILGGILGEAINMGLPNAMDDILKQAKSSHVRYNMAYDNLSGAVFSSDFEVMSRIVDEVGSQVVNANFPNFVSDFLRAYQFAPGDTEALYATRYTELTGLFARIDPNWDKRLRAGQWMSSVTPFINVSNDAYTLFTSTPGHRVPATLGRELNLIQVPSWIKSNYPYFPA